MPSPLPWSPRMPPPLPWSPPMPPPLPPMPPGGPPTLLLASLSHLIEDDAAFTVSCVLLLVAACAVPLFCYRTLTSCKLTRPGRLGSQNPAPMESSKQLPMHAYESLVDFRDDDNESGGHTPRVETPFTRGVVKRCTSVFEARTSAFQARRGNSRVSGTTRRTRTLRGLLATQRSSEQTTPALPRRMTLGATGLHPLPVRTDSERAMMAHGRGGSSSRAGTPGATERLAHSLARSMRGLAGSRDSSWRLRPLASIREYETHA